MFESIYHIARRVLKLYWKGYWKKLAPTPTALRKCSQAGIDPLEILRSYHHKLNTKES